MNRSEFPSLTAPKIRAVSEFPSPHGPQEIEPKMNRFGTSNYSIKLIWLPITATQIKLLSEPEIRAKNEPFSEFPSLTAPKIRAIKEPYRSFHPSRPPIFRAKNEPFWDLHLQHPKLNWFGISFQSLKLEPKINRSRNFHRTRPQELEPKKNRFRTSMSNTQN